MKKPPTSRVRIGARDGGGGVDAGAQGVRLEPERAAVARGGGAASSPGVKTPAMLEASFRRRSAVARGADCGQRAQSLLQLLLADEETLTPATRAAAVKNWCAPADASRRRRLG